MNINLTEVPYLTSREITNLHIDIQKDGKTIHHAESDVPESRDADAVLEALQDLVKHDLLPVPTVNGKAITKEEFNSLYRHD